MPFQEPLMEAAPASPTQLQAAAANMSSASDATAPMLHCRYQVLCSGQAVQIQVFWHEGCRGGCCAHGHKSMHESCTHSSSPALPMPSSTLCNACWSLTSIKMHVVQSACCPICILLNNVQVEEYLHTVKYWVGTVQKASFMS